MSVIFILSIIYNQKKQVLCEKKKALRTLILKIVSFRKNLYKNIRNNEKTRGIARCACTNSYRQYKKKKSKNNPTRGIKKKVNKFFKVSKHLAPGDFFNDDAQFLWTLNHEEFYLIIFTHTLSVVPKVNCEMLRKTKIWSAKNLWNCQSIRGSAY